LKKELPAELHNTIDIYQPLHFLGTKLLENISLPSETSFPYFKLEDNVVLEGGTVGSSVHNKHS